MFVEYIQVIEDFINQLMVYRGDTLDWQGLWKTSASKDQGVSVSAVLPAGQWQSRRYSSPHHTSDSTEGLPRRFVPNQANGTPVVTNTPPNPNRRLLRQCHPERPQRLPIEFVEASPRIPAIQRKTLPVGYQHHLLRTGHWLQFIACKHKFHVVLTSYLVVKACQSRQNYSRIKFPCVSW